MTIATDTASATYTGNGVTAIFPIPFYFLVDTDIKVTRKSAATGLVTTLVLNSDYTLTGAGVQAGGSLTTVPALPNLDQIFIERNVAAVQQTAYPVNSPFPAASHERALDRLTMLVQQIRSALSFGLFRNPLTATYDAGGNTISNAGQALLANDVPTLSQVQNVAAAAAAGIPGGIGSFTQTGAGAVVRTYLSKMRDAFDVRDFGAVSGTGSNTAAFLACLTAAAAAGSPVQVPAGEWHIAVTIPSNTWLRVMPGATIKNDLTVGTDMLYIASGAHDITVEGGKFIGITGTTASAINSLDTSGASFVSNVTIRGCHFTTFGGAAVAIKGLKHVIIEDCIFEQCSDMNISSYRTAVPALFLSDSQNPGVYDQCQFVHIDNCTFRNCYWSAVYLNGVNCSLTHCRIFAVMESAVFISEFGGSSMVANNQIVQTTMRDISGCGIENGANFMVITGNNIGSCATYGISIQNARYCQITGNHIYNCDVGFGLISSSTTAYPLDINFNGNGIANSVTYGIYVLNVSGTAPANCNLEGNHIAGTTPYLRYNLPGAAQFSVRHNRNNQASSAPTTVGVGTSAMGTGAKTFGSFAFKPKHFRVNSARAGASVATSHCDVTQDPGTGAWTAIGILNNGTNTGAIANAVQLQNSSGTAQLVADITAVSFNTTTNLFDVTGTITTNTGIGAAVNITAYP